MKCFSARVVFVFASFLTGAVYGQVELPGAKPVPALQVLPHANDETAIERDAAEITRFHFGPKLRRPFLYPLVGPSGKSHTRLGHPHDPHTHSHHHSVWISHHQVNGVDFWGDRGKNVGTIVVQRIARYVDGDDEALIEAELHWLDGERRALLHETRTMRFRPLANGEWLLILDLELSAPEKAVTLGKTPFGPIGVRMAKTIGVHDGGGTIRNSAGGRDEAEVHWKPAKWVDYSGPLTSDASGGITLFDHPENPRHPAHFHVRDDGWMGASPTHTEPLVMTPDEKLRLRYGLWVHAGVPKTATIDDAFDGFAKIGAPAKHKK